MQTLNLVSITPQTTYPFPTFGTSATEQNNRRAILVQYHEGPAAGSVVVHNAERFWDSVEGYCPETGHPLFPGHGACEVLRTCSAHEVRLLYGIKVGQEAGVIIPKLGPAVN